MAEKLQTVIFFVRHGQTDRVYSTNKSVDGERVLTEEGKMQMKVVGEYLHQFAPVGMYTSPIFRTRQCAEIIQNTAEVSREIEVRNELVEVYSNSDYESVAVRMPKFFQEIIKSNPGKHVICISHQDVIQATLNAYELTESEKAFPCQMGELYRLVFAGEALVECQKLNPARV